MLEIDFYKIGIDPQHAASVAHDNVLDSRIDWSMKSKRVIGVRRDIGSDLGW
jgi:hypothetical protein